MTVKPKEPGWPQTCACCGLTRTFYLDSPTAQHVCDECKRHSTGDWSKVSALHRDWWLARMVEVAEVDSQLRETILSREQQIVALTDKQTETVALIARRYQDAPIGDLQVWVQSAAVALAEDQRGGAYRARDRAMRVLWQLDNLHNDRQVEGTCKCGTPTSKCKEFAALAAIVEELDDWETKQLDRLDRGLDSGLPREHPAMTRRFGYPMVRDR